MQFSGGVYNPTQKHQNTPIMAHKHHPKEARIRAVQQHDGGRPASEICKEMNISPAIRQEDFVRVLLEAMIREEARPENIRSDNGSEFIAETVQGFMAEKGIRGIYIVRAVPGRTASSRASTRASGRSSPTAGTSITTTISRSPWTTGCSTPTATARTAASVS